MAGLLLRQERHGGRQAAWVLAAKRQRPYAEAEAAHFINRYRALPQCFDREGSPGTAWQHSGLGAGARLVTVERNEELARRAASVFADDERVSVLTGDWRLLEQHAPFDVFFCDGGGKRDDPRGVVEQLAPGGLLILDDFTPSPHCRLVSAAKWMSSVCSTSLIQPWTPLKYSPHQPVQRLLLHAASSQEGLQGS